MTMWAAKSLLQIMKLENLNQSEIGNLSHKRSFEDVGWQQETFLLGNLQQGCLD